MQNLNILRVTAGSGINQIRGINRSGATGAGIPQHVTNVSTSMANASVGSTSTVSVTFRRDPSDVNFNGVTVWVKGYQGNQTPTQVASGTDSPINFILNNTGEALSVTVQANGNGGSAPINTAPTAGLTLPRSNSGGAGTTTTTSGPTLKTNGTSNSSQSTLNLKNGSAITVTSGAGGDETINFTSSNITLSVPAEFSVSGSPATTASGGAFTINKANENANTVWAGPASGAAAAPSFRSTVPNDLPATAQWFRWSGDDISGFGTQTSPTWPFNNALQFCRMLITAPVSLAKISVRFNNIVTGAGCVAVYDSTGTTKLADAGTSPFNTQLTTVQTVSITPVTLNPGTYLIAWGTTNATTASGQGLGHTNSNVSNAVANQNVTRSGTAANTISAGAMPSSLGALTAATNNIPGIFLET